MTLHTRHFTRIVALATAMAVVGALAACSGSGTSTGAPDSKSINVLLYNGKHETHLSELAAEYFTAKTGITVNIKLIDENNLHHQVQQELANQAGQYDVMSVGGYEPALYGANGWLSPLNQYVDDDADYDQADILPSVAQVLTGSDGNIYAAPTTTDTSLLMYNKAMFEAAGVTMPEHPTWDQVESIAATLKSANPDVSPICMRGLAGWGMLGSSLTTVVNTFGGTWFTKDWEAQVDSPEFEKATQFYVDLLQNYGPADSATNGVIECFNTFSSGKAAMWYDSSNAPAYLEPAGSPLAGNVGYVAAPTYEQDGKASGWLYTWAMGIEKSSPNQASAAAFVKWASSKEFTDLVAEKYGWAEAPAGQRSSLYANPDYQASGTAFIPITQWSFENIDPANPGAQPRPTVGVQYVAIPEFAELGDKVTQAISSAIAGKETVQEALDTSQSLAEDVAAKYQK